MIDAKDLRIGNWVLRLGNPTQINAVSKGYVSTHSSGSITENQIESIPLTPEILEKCGFEKVGNEWQNTNSEFTECFQFKNDKFYYTGGEGVCFGVGCQYLHELQNLYYALTKQELNYTP